MSTVMRKKAAAGLQAGDNFTLTRTFSQQDTEDFGAVTRDFNPVHYELSWSNLKGFSGQICHGLLVGAMVCEIGGQLGWLATGLNFKFLRPVYFGQSITCELTVTKADDQGRAEAEAEMYNAQGEKVCLATLQGRVPRGAEQELLQSIMDQEDSASGLR